MSVAVESMLSRSIKVEVRGDLNSWDIVIWLSVRDAVFFFYF